VYLLAVTYTCATLTVDTKKTDVLVSQSPPAAHVSHNSWWCAKWSQSVHMSMKYFVIWPQHEQQSASNLPQLPSVVAAGVWPPHNNDQCDSQHSYLYLDSLVRLWVLDSTPTSQKDSWGFPRLLSAEYADGSVWLMAHLLRAVTCLGVTLDQELTFADHIRRLTGRCFHSLRQLRSIRRILTTDTIITLVNALSSVELTTVTLSSLACTTSICGSSNEFSTLQHD